MYKVTIFFIVFTLVVFGFLIDRLKSRISAVEQSLHTHGDITIEAGQSKGSAVPPTKQEWENIEHDHDKVKPEVNLSEWSLTNDWNAWSLKNTNFLTIALSNRTVLRVGYSYLIQYTDREWTLMTNYYDRDTNLTSWKLYGQAERIPKP